MRRTSGALLGVVAVAGLAAAWVVLRADEAPGVQVATARVSTGPVVRRVIATGTVEAVTTAEVGSQVSGRIVALYVDFDSPVDKDQILARIDPSIYQARLAQARAALAKARADAEHARVAVRDARTRLTRTRQLTVRQLLTQADLDSARTVFNQAQADQTSADAAVALARAALDQAQVDLDHTIIRSPIDGNVIARSVDVGQTVAATMSSPTLYTLADLDHVEVDAQVDESDVGRVHRGESAAFEVDAYPDREFAGTVTQVRIDPIEESTAANTGPSSAAGKIVRYTTIISARNDDHALRPGMTATITLTVGERRDAVRVPNDALTFRPSADVLAAAGQPASLADRAAPSAGSRPGGARVWRYRTGRFVPVTVAVGLVGAGYAELVGGPLRPGDAVVTSAIIARARVLSARSPLVPQRRRFFRGRR
ncbi:MAG: efflux RND transporter periplasmic adaptor subunit [Betaproteobacteria bacterium]